MSERPIAEDRGFEVARQTRIRWVLHRRGVDVVCTTEAGRRGGIDVVLTLAGVTIEREICRSSPGSEEQVAAWRQMYEAYGWTDQTEIGTENPNGQEDSQKDREEDSKAREQQA